MSTITIQVDGQKLTAKPGQMLIEVTDQAGIHIPRFCYHPKLSVAANCRMCLVEVEKAPKPLPACATPVMDGMVVQTQSELARGAQQGTMEFLLINHPLDCPICDQGGECQLQEQSIDYGANASRYHENKRQVANPDIGPLIATWMTRCIHCTRCVRFGEEIAGVMELGMMGRGEQSKIITSPKPAQDPSDAGQVDAFLCRSVQSELSGNVIELCPVGALTAKPSKYAARVWEMQNHPSISPHDCVGSNLNIQTLRGEIIRTMVRENDQVNACWLADRDRYSYEAVLSGKRLTSPMIKDKKGWHEVSWESALKHAAAGLNTVKKRHGAEKIGALASPGATMEELFLTQKLMRALGSNNIDHRLRQEDFSDDAVAPLYPGSELEIARFESLNTVLLLGSNIRKEQPILGLYLRQAAVKNGATISAINLVDYDFHFPLTTKQQVTSQDFVRQLANVALEIAQRTSVQLDKAIVARAGNANKQTTAIALSLLDAQAGDNKAIILGASALAHPQASALIAIADWLCQQTNSKLVKLPEANTAGAWVTGCIPHRLAHGNPVEQAGLHAKDMLTQSLNAYLLYGVEPGLDAHRSGEALNTLKNSDFVVQCAAFVSKEAKEYADVLLPIACFAETAGALTNCEGRVQTTRAAAQSPGQARPGWKVLRVLANYLDLKGFDHITLEDVRDDLVLGDDAIVSQRGALIKKQAPKYDKKAIYRVIETPMYRLDMTLRHAKALQRTADTPAPGISLNKKAIARLGLKTGKKVAVSQNGRQVKLTLSRDNRLLDTQAYIPAGYTQTSALSGLDTLTIEAL